MFFTRRGAAWPKQRPEALDQGRDLDAWLDRNGVFDGSPYLIDPRGMYDVRLNSFFTEIMYAEPAGTQEAYAYDLKKYLAFLWEARGVSWRDADEEDRRAYHQWRVRDPRGPRIDAVTWDREVSTVNRFYQWAVRRKHVERNPIVHRDVRPNPFSGSVTATVPAELSHTGKPNRIAWLPPATYRRWRDVGLRGFTADGRADPSFRGGFASRNCTYADLMIRTGLRLAEQTSLSLFELPRPAELAAGQRYARSWLPAEIAKWGSARNVYYSASVLRDLWDFVELERADAIERARERGLYERIRDPLIVKNPDAPHPYVTVGGRRRRVDRLGHAERLRLLIQTPDGLEPAALWLNRNGMPSRPDAWQEVFKTGSERCARLGVPTYCHPHMLRHSYAVITLEQLQRGHIQELAAMTRDQRTTFQMIFGDPLNWVRMRLGHASTQTTLIYLHALQELEAETKLALVPDEWDAVGVHPEDLFEKAAAHVG